MSEFSDEEELERQLAALNMNNTAGKGKKEKPVKPTANYDDLDCDDDELLAELNELIGEDEPVSAMLPKRSAQSAAEARSAFNERRISMELSEAEDEPGGEEEAELAALMASDAKPKVQQMTGTTQSSTTTSTQSRSNITSEVPKPNRAQAGADMERATPPAVPQHHAVQSGTIQNRQDEPNRTGQEQEQDPKALAKKIITRRLAAFTTNGLAANKDGNSRYAAECAENVQLFQQALQMCDTADITMADLEGIPKTPPPYKSKAPAPLPAFPTGPLSLEDELNARLAKFKWLAGDFESKGENIKMKMNQRLGTQISSALIRLKKGHPIQPEKLPVPPGFSELKPMAEWSQLTNSTQTAPKSAPKTEEQTIPNDPKPNAPKAAIPGVSVQTAPKPVDKPVEKEEPEDMKKVLEEKQQKFKKAALMYKKNGDMPAAARCLKAARELEKEIKQLSAKKPHPASSPSQTVSSALPAVVTATSVSPASILLQDLKKQLEFAVKMRTKLAAAKQATSVQLYDRLIQKVRIDLQVCSRTAQGNDANVAFKATEMRLPFLEANLDVPTDVLELKIDRIESLKLPDGWKESDASTFVTYEFPFPHDARQKGKTATVYGTIEPTFDEVFQLQINRKGKQLQRILCRYPMKLNVFQKGGFLRSDKPCGEVDVVLDALDEAASFSDSRDLLLGRRKTGGKLSFSVRIQKPINEKKMLTIKPQAWTCLVNQA
ncbi:unnamed protein product [Bursaphelenchus okinawaensis]|uniref:C2 domain-containing protein n=1 Tax=Bursaphelenchus okinawaensis TaxID=465554 RepID=A0A811JWS5_9BILA|nr:unnamed protein product [Bursaphelenchus okinawaensis]CAG9086595.1 unnamed protein product [Bursaphelenchus okinawaensis]